MLLEIVNRDVQSTAGDDAALIEGVFILMTQGDKQEVLFEIGEGQACGPANCFQGRLARPLQLLAQGVQRCFCGRLIKAPDADIDGMDFPSPKNTNDFVSGLF